VGHQGSKLKRQIGDAQILYRTLIGMELMTAENSVSFFCSTIHKYQHALQKAATRRTGIIE
jgi:hypothetical protein